MRKILTVLSVCLVMNVFAAGQTPERPKLVIGLVVDQMRWDFLYRYSSKYSENGFNRLLREGFSCENTHYNYVPTNTAPGHTCVFTGSVPAVHGIISNEWYDRQLKREIYCASDTGFYGLPVDSKNTRMSPRRMYSSTIGDELRISGLYDSKVIGIAIKDRSSIYPAGHAANAAYWFDGGRWSTSSYYMKQLPDWVKNQNAQLEKDKDAQKLWKTLLDLEKYHESTADSVSWEGLFKGEKASVFPHDVSNELADGINVFRNLPYGNTMTLNMAKACIEAENMGKDDITDLLTISLSTTDALGHMFGPNSVEVEDMYIRLDAELASFLQYLDMKVGKGNYLFFMTADHGAANNATFLNSLKVPGGNLNGDKLIPKIQEHLKNTVGEGKFIESFSNQQVFFTEEVLKDEDKREQVTSELVSFLLKQEGIAGVYDLHDLEAGSCREDLLEKLLNSRFMKRSGDVYIELLPQWVEGYVKGTTHGSGYRYDTHVPLVFFGWGISAGKDVEEHAVADIAPTVSMLLHIQEPLGCVGKVIESLWER